MLRSVRQFVCRDRFDNYRGNLVFVLAEEFFNAPQIVVRHVQSERGKRLRYARTFGYAQRCKARTGLRQKAVGVAVVAPFELYDEIALGDSAGEAHGAHRGFSAARNEAHFFDEGNRFGDERGELQLQFCGHAKTCAAPRLLGDGRTDRRMRVAEKHRPPRADVI